MELPEYVQIEPVGQCNLRCRMCPIQFRADGPPHGPAAFMAFDTFTRVLAQFPRLRHLHLQGLGEPMLHPRFFDMVAHAKRGDDVRVTTNTNLTLMDAEACVDSGLDEVHGSLDGATADTFESIRIRARFDKVTDNLRRLVEARARRAVSHPRIQLVMVVMRENVHELPDLVRLARDIGVDSMFVQHLCHDFAEETLPERYAPMRDFVNRQTLTTDTNGYQRYFDEARAIAAKAQFDLRLPCLKARERSGLRCDWPWRGAYVSYRGEAMPCCMISTPDRLNFGNMADEGVRAIWDGEGYMQFRAALASDTPPQICSTCSVYAGTF